MQCPFVPPCEPQSRVRRWARATLVHALRPCQALLGCRGIDAFGILTYHRVFDSVPGVPDPTYNVPPLRLREQLRGLLQLGFEPWPLSRVIAETGQARRIPRRVFVVTFDDGYENTLTRALPVLRELGVPATAFVATAYPGSAEPFPFDDWAAAGNAAVPAEAWRPLTWESAARLGNDELVELGCHTHTHAVFDGTPQFANDLGRSLALLKTRLGIERPAFSFPYGRCNAEWRAAARKAGVSCALSTRRRLACSGSSPFSWGRFGVDAADTASTLAVKLGGWFDAAADLATHWASGTATTNETRTSQAAAHQTACVTGTLPEVVP